LKLIMNAVAHTFKLTCSNSSDRIRMSRLTSLLIAGVSILAGSFIAMPAQASLQGDLQRGQTRYLEVSLEPGTYLVYVLATGDTSEASFSMYETNGKLIKRSSQLPSALQIRTKGTALDKGTAFDIQRSQTVHFWVRMDTCKGLCGFGIVPVKVSSGKMDVVNPPSKVLSKRPSYNPSNSKPPKPNTERTKPTDQAIALKSNQYVFNTDSHVNTGISVNSGDKIKVEASGRIRFGYFVGSGGPKGILISPEYNYFVDIPHGQLMGRIRQFGAQELDGWFPIGEGREFVARSQGVLEFAVNDNRPGDNAGRFRIEVAIIPAK